MQKTGASPQTTAPESATAPRDRTPNPPQALSLVVVYCPEEPSRLGEIRVWAAGGQTLHRVWRAHTDMVWALTLSPDGQTLASGSWDGTVKLWEVASGTLRWVGRHASHINRIVFSSDGYLLASSGNDATVRVWEAYTGSLRHTLAHPGPVIALSWRPVKKPY